MTSETTPLPAQPVNHLSVLAYLAIGIVLLATLLVTGYLIHSCYRSSSRKDAVQRTRALEKTPSIDEAESGKSHKKLTGRRTRRELSPLAREFCYDQEPSLLSDGKTVISNRSDRSFDKDVFVGSPLRLVYPSDSTVAASVSLRTPSPTSPSPAQMRQYAGPTSYSPISPFFPKRSPTLSPYDDRSMDLDQETGTSLNGIQFDSNHIRYVPPLEPCVAESTMKLYKEPKLSPVLGSIVPPSGDGTLFLGQGRKANARQHSYSVVRLAKPSRANLSISMPRKRVRVISGEETVLPRLPELCHKEAINPISIQHVGQDWEPLLPTVLPMNPRPGYF